MQLVEFRVEGVRCLTNVSEIPVTRPTILTGPNDSGKTAAILGLAFLLGNRLNPDDYRIVVSDMKSAHALRTIDLDERTVAVLRSWRKEQLEQYMATGVRIDDAGFVFAKPDGSPLHPDYMSQTFERLLKKLDPPRVRLHDLRHTHATLMLKEGVPVKVVSERLGHSSVAFTMQVYQHVLPGMQADTAQRFGDIVFGS